MDRLLIRRSHLLMILIVLAAAINASDAQTESEIRVPGTLPLDAERLQSLRAEYLVAGDGRIADDDWYLFLQLDKGFYRQEPMQMIHWIGVDRDWSVDDITGVRTSSYETLYRFEPQGTGVYISHLFDPETNTTSGARLEYGAPPRPFSVEGEHPLFAMVAMPYLTAAVQMQPGQAYRLPILRRRTLFEGGAEPLYVTLRHAGSVHYEDTEGNAYEATHYELEITPQMIWSYYVQEEPPYFLGMTSRAGGEEHHVRYTGRYEIFEVSTEDRLQDLIMGNVENRP